MFFMEFPTKRHPKFKDFLVVMVTVMQIVYYLVGNLLSIQT